MRALGTSFKRSSGTHSTRFTRVFAAPGARRRCLFSTLPCWTKASGADLAADLALRRDLRVHVRVGSARANGGDNRRKVTSLELLRCLRPLYDVCRCDHPIHATLLRALRGKAGRIGITGRLAQKDDDAAAYGRLADMDVGLSYRRLQPAKRLPVDYAVTVRADRGYELAPAGC